MLCRLSTSNLLAALIFCISPALRAELGVNAIRQPGSSLDTSLRNEADHAVRQAAAWLAARQNADGSWGNTNRVRLTSLALFALRSSRQPQLSEQQARAALWLDRHGTNRLDSLDTYAWRLLALAAVLPETVARTNLLRRFAAAPSQLTRRATDEARQLWDEALSAAGLAPDLPEPAPPAARDRLAREAAAWPPHEQLSPACAWRLAHLINRAGGGQLVRDNAPLDWRADLAQRLINSQRRAAGSGGFWGARTGEDTIAETSFGILALLEL